MKIYIHINIQYYQLHTKCNVIHTYVCIIFISNIATWHHGKICELCYIYVFLSIYVCVKIRDQREQRLNQSTARFSFNLCVCCCFLLYALLCVGRCLFAQSPVSGKCSKSTDNFILKSSPQPNQKKRIKT